MERTLVFVKPDGVRRRLVGEIVRRFERKGLSLVALKMMRVSEALARRHYEVHVDKPFFPGLLKFVTGGPIVALVLEGNDAIELVRAMMGQTMHTEAAPGTIRGDFAFSTTENLIHGSDSPESAAREIGLFFSDSELVG